MLLNSQPLSERRQMHGGQPRDFTRVRGGLGLALPAGFAAIRNCPTQKPSRGSGFLPEQDSLQSKPDGRRLKMDGISSKTDGISLNTDEILLNTDEIILQTDCIRHKTKQIRYKTDGIRCKTDKIILKTDEIRHKTKDILSMMNGFRCWTDDLTEKKALLKGFFLKNLMKQRDYHVLATHLVRTKPAVPTARQTPAQPIN
jgi:hypothetical protein